MNEPIGLIAGQGRLPVLTATGMRSAGRRVVCVGLRDQFDVALPPLCDDFSTAGIIQIGRWIRLLKRAQVREAVMVGRVKKVRMYDPLHMFRQLPDWRAAKLWFGKLRHDKRNDAILSAVADELAAEGIALIDSTKFIPQELAAPGTMTRREPTADQRADIDFALPIVARMGDLDIGQSIAVRDREIIAVEAIEGTDRMIERAGQLCKRGGWTLVKIAKPQQDMRFDVPTIGLNTIANLAKNGATCLAVEAGKVILLDKPQLLEAADKAGIAILGVRVPV
ncbi:MAG: DUF1009 domain-containing protein [Planctomycetes bacterium]|nr:DUF1009 domain-containing protein [Planctomycetota bacterium]